jgi:orotidine-5'-phosphate decarboxylase
MNKIVFHDFIKGYTMKKAKDYLIYPLDVPNMKQARHYVEILSHSVGLFKIGLELFTREGPEIIRQIKTAAKGAGIFLDLKLHDIPETVRRTMAVIADLGVTFTTVHCGDSLAMLKAAAEGAAGKTGILGVTVLTSLSTTDLKAAGYAPDFTSDTTQLVLKRAGMAKDAGFAGVICSGFESTRIKEFCGKNFLAVTPGIRPAWELTDTHDQKRVMTPARAIRNGSDYLVVGRPIRDAADPAKAAMAVIEEIETALPDTA